MRQLTRLVVLVLKNGVDLGVGLHSRYTAVKIIDQVVNDIKNDIFTKSLNKMQTLVLSLMKPPALYISYVAQRQASDCSPS